MAPLALRAASAVLIFLTVAGLATATAMFGSLVVLSKNRRDTTAPIAALQTEVAALREEGGRPVAALPSTPAVRASAVVIAGAIAARVAAKLAAASGGPKTAPRAPADHAEESVAAPPRPPPPPPTPEQLEASAKAEEVLGAAMAHGHLTRDDVIGMRSALANAQPSERQELRRQIVVAVNSGKLRTDDRRFPMP
jgi:hypothetical protein